MPFGFFLFCFVFGLISDYVFPLKNHCRENPLSFAIYLFRQRFSEPLFLYSAYCFAMENASDLNSIALKCVSEKK